MVVIVAKSKIRLVIGNISNLKQAKGISTDYPIDKKPLHDFCVENNTRLCCFALSENYTIPGISFIHDRKKTYTLL